uniref:Protein transport protein sec16 n=1 Tax=Oncorhynchus kisutch TaxID=8019 RepID=A0A8C7KQK9_ONCKI
MQPPPRTGPPGASGPPPAGVGPNAFRRTRPHKHTGAAVMAGLTAQPMTDPFAFGRQAPPPMATGHLPPPNNSPLPLQALPPGMYHQAGMGQGLHQPQPLDSAQAGAVPLGPPPPSTPGVSILTPHGTASPVPFPGQQPGPPGHAPPSAEQGYFNSREPAPSMTPGHLPMASAPMSGQAPYGQDHGGDHHPQAMPFKPVPPVLSQWVPDHGSRPPSVQNYFQPTSDPLPQVCNAPPQSQISPHTPLPHNTPPTHPQQQHQPQPPPQHPDRPTSSQWPDLAGANTPQQHNAHFQAQTYFSQSSDTLDSWFNQHPQDLVYHQMGAGPGLARPDSARTHYRHDSAGSHHGSHYGSYHASTPGPAPVPFIPDGTISMFFKGNDVENEETLAGEGARAVNGLQDFQPSHNHQQMSSPQPQANPVVGAEATHSYRGPPPQAGQSLTYMNDGNFPGAGKPIQQKPAEAQFDHVENLECVPNQEVLPSEPQSNPAVAAAHGGDCYEAGPNLETPDSVPRPIRSASVSSSYSNLSHGSGTGTVPRRHQGVVGTFIQQESPRPSEDAFSSAAAGGYFEQIDTSPAGDMAVAYQSIPERMCHSQPPTPSPPKPTGIFQASANSSFEPVRSHSVAVRPAEVDRARMVAERGSDSLPGNLEQPPDNLENIYGAATGHTQAGDGAGAPPLAYPLSHSHSRPSSRAHVAHRPCESPATTLWAQHDPASLGTNILLVPAAPPVLAPLREPSAEVIQPPEDGSLDLQPPQHAPPPSQHPSENLENPPKVSEGDTSDSQPNLGYASLLVSESLHQPVLIAPPTSNYSVIPPSNPALAANQVSPREATVPVRPPSQAQGASAAQPVITPQFDVSVVPPNMAKSSSNGVSVCRPQGYDDKWRYYPGYDASFDDDYRRQRDQYKDDFDRRSVHSEQSAHSLHSSQSHRSRRSSFSSRSQQSEVYRSQPDLTAVYDPTVSTLPVDYSYGQYPEQMDPGQSFSQYPYTSGYQADNSTWVVAEQPPPRPVTPEKYSVSHRCARFGPGGQLIQVLPNLPSAGQPALVEIHNMETMLQDTPDQSELRSFPGPLLKEETHKVDVIKFSQNKGLECARNNDLLDKDSAALLWDFIVLLCRQNGTVVGTDIADLLLKEHRSVWLPGKSPNEANLIDFNNEPLARAEEEPGTGPLSLLSDTFMTVPENIGKETERFRELLLFGRKKDALEAAMKGALWGHALLLASKMDSRTHARVMTRFANSLPINDPLQTVYQLMSGRMPASATCCGDEKWGDWRPHLAMVLSNLTHTLDLDTRTITTMGDTLASKGLTDAAHFCYLMAQVGLGVFTKKSTKMVLIGSNHSLSFFQFASNEAIQRTEAYEYAQSLGSQPCSLPNFQVFKLIYACRLAEAGLCAQAFHYCEVISRSVLMQPSYHSPVFTSQLMQMSEKMRFFDPQLKEKADQELFNEPEWLINLRQLDGQMRTGVIVYNADRATPQQYDCSTPNSELDQTSPPEPYAHPLDMVGHTSDNPLMTSLMPGPPQQGVQLMPPGKQQAHRQPPGRRSRTMSESSTHSGGRERSNSAAKQSSPPPPSIPDLYMAVWSVCVCIGADEYLQLTGLFCQIVWDEKKQKWVNLDEPEEEYKPPPPPPSGFPKMLGPIPGQGGPGGPPTGGPPVNMFSRRAGTKSRYVDVLNPGGPRAKPGGSAPAPSDFFAPLAPMPMPANLFVPGAEEQQPMVGNVPETGGNQEQSDPNPSAVPQVPYYTPSDGYSCV